MGIRRTKHAVYDLKYHLVWIPKYRKHIFDKEVSDYIKVVFNKVAEEYEFRIDTMEVMEDHVHIFLGFPPKYSISNVVKNLKGSSARAIFQKYPEVKDELWGGEFWEDGYCARTVGDKVTKDMIKKYIRYHKDHERTPQQLELF